MNEKISIQEIIEALVTAKNIDRQEAEVFVRSLFSIIREALETDKYIKIKGLGSFKLIEVNSRKSVDVNTGERILIEGHTKISFTPDSQLRELINKPFSFFETVVLNEGTVLDDTLVCEEESDDENEPEEEIIREPIENSLITEKQENKIAKEDVRINKSEKQDPPLSSATEATQKIEITSEKERLSESEKEEKNTFKENRIRVTIEEEQPKEPEQLKEPGQLRAPGQLKEPAQPNEFGQLDESARPGVSEQPEESGQTIELTPAKEPTLIKRTASVKEPEFSQDREAIKKEEPEKSVNPDKTEAFANELSNGLSIKTEPVPGNNETSSGVQEEKKHTPPISENMDKETKQGLPYFIFVVILVITMLSGILIYIYKPDILFNLLPDAKEKPEVQQDASPEGLTPETPSVLTDTVQPGDTLDIPAVGHEPVIPQGEKTVPAKETAQPEAKPARRMETGLKKSSPSEKADLLKAEPVRPEKKANPKKIPFTPDSTSYNIIGTKTSYTIKEGETLTMVSLKFYGTKALWPYLVKHNPKIITNPDRVPYGTTIRIPELKSR